MNNNQVQYAKLGWTVIVIIGGLLGYTLSATPVANKDDLSARISSIEKSLEELNVKIPALPTVEQKK